MGRTPGDAQVNAIAILLVGVALAATRVWIPAVVVLLVGALLLWRAIRRSRG